MPLERWEEEELFAPRNRNPPGAGGGGGGSFDDFAPPSSTSRRSSNGSSGSASRGSRGSRGGRGRGGGRRGRGARGGRGAGGGWGQPLSPQLGSDGDDDFALPQPVEPQRKRTANRKEYYPRIMSGAFAILGQLWLFEQEGTASADKATLTSAAQRFSKDPMATVRGPHVTAASSYNAWSAMTKTLEAKALVERNTKGGKRHTFRLSAEGRELAARIVEDHPDIFRDFHDASGEPNADDLQPPPPPPPPPPSLPSGSPPGPRASSSVPGGTACTRKAHVSVANPYLRTAPSIAAAGVPARKSITSAWTGRVSGGSGNSIAIGSGRGSAGGGKTKTALAAEARRAREIASSELAAAAAGTMAVPKNMGSAHDGGGAARKKAAGAAGEGVRAMGSATKRARLLQESGEVNYEKRTRLYQQLGSTGPPSSGANIAGVGKGKDGGKKGAVGSPLLVALQRCGSRGESGKKAGGAEEKEKEGDGLDALGPMDEAWLTLTRGASDGIAATSSRGGGGGGGSGAGLASPRTEVGASPRKRCSGSSSSSSSRTLGSAEKKRFFHQQKIGSVGSIALQRGDRGKPGGGGTGTGAGAGAGGMVVDISLSDDEDDAHVVGVGASQGRAPPPSARAPVSAGDVLDVDGGAAGAEARVGESGGEEEKEGEEEGEGGEEEEEEEEGLAYRAVFPWRSETCYRSLTRAGADGSVCGALDWRGRPCPAWLRQELSAGTVGKKDRMLDAFDLVLLVDTGEPKALISSIRDAATATRQKLRRRAEFAGMPMPHMGLQVYVTRLEVADYMWAWRRRGGESGGGLGSGSGACLQEGAKAGLPGEKMLVVDSMAERKSADDIVGSVEGKRGRYVSQKRKMALCGLTKLIYLLEGELIGFKKPTTGVDMTGMFRTVEATTQAQGFAVKITQGHEGTANFLMSMSTQLMLCQGLESAADFCSNPCRPKMSFAEFYQAMRPDSLESPTVSLNFGKCLTAVFGISAEGALAISRAFRSPRDYANALGRCGTAKEKLDLVQNLKLSDGGKSNSVQRIGPSVAGKLVSLFDPKDRS